MATGSARNSSRRNLVFLFYTFHLSKTSRIFLFLPFFSPDRNRQLNHSMETRHWRAFQFSATREICFAVGYTNRFLVHFVGPQQSHRRFNSPSTREVYQKSLPRSLQKSLQKKFTKVYHHDSFMILKNSIWFRTLHWRVSIVSTLESEILDLN